MREKEDEVAPVDAQASHFPVAFGYAIDRTSLLSMDGKVWRPEGKLRYVPRGLQPQTRKRRNKKQNLNLASRAV